MPSDQSIRFYVDNVEYTVQMEMMAGGQIRALAKVPANYQLIIEGIDGPDAIVPTAEHLIVSGRHFYTVPPTTYA